MSLEDLKNDITKFCDERDWRQFHSPKNLAIAVATEAAELLEIFQWLTLEESQSLPAEKLQHAKEEIGDVMICLVNLATRLGIDPLTAAKEKLGKNRRKYPVSTARGIAEPLPQED